MAPNWVDVLTLIVLFATLLAALGAGYEAYQLANLTGKAITSAKDDAKAQRDLATTAEMRQLRAYVGIVGFRLDVDKKEKSPHMLTATTGYYTKSLFVKAKNNGLTPAYTTYIYAALAPQPFGSAPPPLQRLANAYDPHPNGNKEIFNLNKDGSYEAILPLGDDQVAWIQGARKMSMFVFVIGYVEYCDIYQRKWRRPFRAQYMPVIALDYWQPQDLAQPETQVGSC